MFRRLVDVVLTGFPFAVYKAGTGTVLIPLGYPIIGGIFLAWGIVDFIMNLLGLVMPKRVAICSLAGIGRLMPGKQAVWHERMLAIDMFFSFSIVAMMLWFGGLALLDPRLGKVWNLAVVLNVMGAGATRVYDSMQIKASDSLE
jgi:hypothetical protein